MKNVIYIVRAIKQKLKLNKTQYKLVKHYCYHSRALYNSSLYICQQFFKETGLYIGYNQLYHQIKNNYHYEIIPSMIAQQIVRLVDKNYRIFFSLLRKKNKGQYADNVNPPNFKKSDSEFILILDSTRVKIKKDKLQITKNLVVPFTYKINGTIKQTIIKPKGDKYYEIIINYEENQKPDIENQLNKTESLSIDLGVNNFASCYSRKKCFIINGKPLKSYNQYFNKNRSKILRELKAKNDKRKSNLLSRLSNNRYNWVNNYISQSVALILKYCIGCNIGTVVCGYNELWKQNLNLGRKNNQEFAFIPYRKFIDKLRSKCEEYGILFYLQEESYTSKCSFLDGEDVKKHEKYKGKRVKRGLFQTQNGTKVNADINASANIGKKYFGTDFASEPNRGGTVTPVVLNIFNPTELDKFYLSCDCNNIIFPSKSEAFRLEG